MRDRLGHAVWAVGVAQFFAVHSIVESAWKRPYSWAAHNISDLGNVTCGPQGREPAPRYVCSPEHALMNASFVALGVLFLAGVVLAGGLWRGGPAGTAARVALGTAAAGFALVGLAPADVDERLHVLGALLGIGVGNVGLLLSAAGLSDRVAGVWRWGAAALGVVASTACVLLLLRQDLGLGMGGMERVAAYPILLWAFALGVAGLFGRAGRVARSTPVRRPEKGERRA
ncbi:DUF998 domain-containing protein [Streptomyces sp. UH6]|uniref:DUF998 domain-containing protein n=1 Tax=Streptomyces sp. UH6 TaxID=2748379 RepID=UPI0015D4C747|nr:DUF998 domain-containing protein [Streptomyces sp. UH6]NYV74290.1 DUF998 domain-containing protein [Streptomyces sp. UH6]